MEFIRWTALVILLAFSGYTIYASRKENFWKSFRTVMQLNWGRQVVADLYIGLLLFTFIIYLHEASALIAVAWLIPTLILGNLVPLIYFVIHFDSIASAFLN